jgi:hypothetical protein
MASANGRADKWTPPRPTDGWPQAANGQVTGRVRRQNLVFDGDFAMVVEQKKN